MNARRDYNWTLRELRKGYRPIGQNEAMDNTYYTHNVSRHEDFKGRPDTRMALTGPDNRAPYLRGLKRMQMSEWRVRWDVQS